VRGPGWILLGLLAACGEQAGREPPAVARQAADSASVGIAARLEQLVWNQTPPPYTSDARWALIRRAYNGRHYAPLWLGTAGPTEAGSALISVLCDALDEGIHPAAFTADSTAGLLAEAPDTWGSAVSAGRLAGADLRLTAAFLDYLGALATGQVEPGEVAPDWRAAPPPQPADSELARALRLPPADAVRLFRPASPAYDRLRTAFARYRLTARNGDWMLPDTVRVLRPGVRDSAVIPLRRRLIRTADLAARESVSTLFDSTLLAAVRHAQRRLGVPADGVVGPGTWHALTVPAAVRARRVAANLERYRWLPRGGSGTVLVLDEGAGRAELWAGAERRFAGDLRLGGPCPAAVPVLADTVRDLRPEGSGLTLVLAGGTAVRLAAPSAPAGTCALVAGFDGLAPLLSSSASGTIVLYFLTPTAVASPAGGATFRRDTTGGDDRLEAALGPILSRSEPPACAGRATAAPPPREQAARAPSAQAPLPPAPARAGRGSVPPAGSAR
jgi:peptidoglycan hydrolase-like protein with peptidoglycan-binding domain